MRKILVEIYKDNDNFLAVHIGKCSTDMQRKLDNVILRQPVVKYSSGRECWLVSLYHYKHLLRSLRSKLYIDLRVEKSVDVAYNKLMRKFKWKYDKNKKLEYPMLWNKEYKLYKYQEEAVSTILRHRKYINGTEMGLGKTAEAIHVILTAFDWGYEKALVVCPSALIEQWKMEIKKFSKVPDEDIVIIGSRYKCLTGANDSFHAAKKVCKECEHYENCKNNSRNGINHLRRYQLKTAKIAIMSYEVAREHTNDIVKAKYDVYIYDEANKLKNHSAMVTREATKIMRKRKFDDIVVFMSGTIIENSIIEFYPAFNMIDRAVFGTWTNFQKCFLINDIFGNPVGVRNEELLLDTTSKFIIRHTVADVWHDRPTLFEYNRYCVMGEIQRKLYEDIAAGVVQDLRDKELEIKIKKAELVALMTYMLQAAGSVEVMRELGKYKSVDYSTKLQMLLNILTDEIGDKKVVVFCRFAHKILKPIISKTLNKAGIKHLMVVGGDKDRQKKVNKFVDGDVNVLLSSDTLSYGVNLQKAHYVINFDLPWNPAILDQRIARVYRKGQDSNVTVINLITKDTIESHVYNTIYNKRQMFNKFIGAGIVEASKANISVDYLLGALS